MSDNLISRPLTETTIGDVTVSTVYIFSAQEMMDGILQTFPIVKHIIKPHIKALTAGTSRILGKYETLVMGGNNNGYMRRCDNQAEALKQHEEVVKLISI